MDYRAVKIHLVLNICNKTFLARKDAVSERPVCQLAISSAVSDERAVRDGRSAVVGADHSFEICA